MSTRYPNGIDSDAQIPSVSDNITEIGADSINGLKDAVVAIERTIGISPQGNKTSLEDRISTSLDKDGNIKTSALEERGVVARPIDNSDVDDNAAIAESKLDLDYPTNDLHSELVDLDTRIEVVHDEHVVLANRTLAHIAGADYNHDGYGIKINKIGTEQVGTTGISSDNVGGALNEIGDTLFGENGHIDASLGKDNFFKHQAHNILVDPHNFNNIQHAERLQDVLDNTDEEIGRSARDHLDVFHSNGIFRHSIIGIEYDPNNILFDGTVSFEEGSQIITLSETISEEISCGDIIEIYDIPYTIISIGEISDAETIGNQTKLEANQIRVASAFNLPGTNISAKIFKQNKKYTLNAPLACSIRNTPAIADSICIFNPSAAHVISYGFNGAIMSGDGYDVGIEVGLGGGIHRTIVITDLNRDRLESSKPSVVDSNSVAERINAFVTDPEANLHFPITAYGVENEIVISHNWTGDDGYTIKILDGYSANYAMGLDGYGSGAVNKTIVPIRSKCFSVGGKQLFGFNRLFSAKISPPAFGDEVYSFELLNEDGYVLNPKVYGLGAGSIMNVSGHTDSSINGSYVLTGCTDTTVSISEVIFSDNDLYVWFDNSSISTAQIAGTGVTDQGILQVFIDSNANTILQDRLSYGIELGSTVSIVGISDNFPAGSYAINYSTVGLANTTFELVDSNSLSGDSITVSSSFIGKFKLYHPNNIDYVEVKVIAGGLAVGNTDVFVKQYPQNKDLMELCQAHFSGPFTLNNIIDTRHFGNVGKENVSSGFVEALIESPIKHLRSNGVIRGFKVLDDLPFADDVTGITSLPLSGGTAYVSGKQISVKTQKVVIPTHDQAGDPNTNKWFTLAINEHGTIYATEYEIADLLDTDDELNSKYGKLLPLYRVFIDADMAITEYIDIRLFIQKLDEKLDIIVGSTPTNSIGSFKSLKGAIEYLNAYPGQEKRTIKIIGTVEENSTINLPHGVNLIGESMYGGDGYGKIITNNYSSPGFIVLGGNNEIKNIDIYCESGGQNLGPLVYYSGAHDILIHYCKLHFDDATLVPPNTGSIFNYAIYIRALGGAMVQIENNKIETCYCGITVRGSSRLIKIENNIISGIEGVGQGVYGMSIIQADCNIISIINNIINVPHVNNRSVAPISILGIVNVDRVIVSKNTITNEYDDLSSAIIVSGPGIKTTTILDNKIFGINNEYAYWAIHVSQTGTCYIQNNTIEDFNINSSCIKCSDNDNVIILSNIIKNNNKSQATFYGIYVNNESLEKSHVYISSNVLDMLGEKATYIFTGNCNNSKITNNMLVGPATEAIVGRGNYMVISENTLKNPELDIDLADQDYSFFNGISFYGNFCIIKNNIIVGMPGDGSTYVYPISSLYGSTISSAQVVGNTIKAQKISTGIYLGGTTDDLSTGNIISGNNIHSDEFFDESIMIHTNNITSSIISNNVISGAFAYGIRSTDLMDSVSITNNVITAESGLIEPILLNGDNANSTSYCFVSGNKVTSSKRGNFVIGKEPSKSDLNTNVIINNPGISHKVTIPFSDFISGYDGDTESFGWAVHSGENWWRPIISGVPLLASINIPDGFKMTKVQFEGKGGGNNWEVNVIRNLEDEEEGVEPEIGTKILSTTSGFFSETILINDEYGVVNNSVYQYRLKISVDSPITESERFIRAIVTYE